MARCPKCNENWFWDWEQDTYRYVDGSEIETIILNCIEKGMELETYVFKCKCNSINSLMYYDKNRGSACCNIKEWENINWENEGNTWESKCKDCKNLTCLNDEKDYCQNINCLYEDIEG